MKHTEGHSFHDDLITHYPVIFSIYVVALLVAFVLVAFGACALISWLFGDMAPLVLMGSCLFVGGIVVPLVLYHQYTKENK